jgi:TonB family protein
MPQSSHAVLALTLSFVVLLAAACSSTAVDPAEGSEELCAAMVQPPVPRAEGNSDIQAPVVIRKVEPVAGRSLRGRSADATVEAIIGEDGKVRNVCVISGDPEWGRAVARAVRQWEFKPGTMNGKPVAVIFTLTTAWRS